MRRAAGARLFFYTLGLTATVLGCALEPPYTRGQAVETIVSVCRDKYQLNVTPRIVGDSLYVSMDVRGLLGRVTPEGKILQADVDKIVDLFEVTTRICLSAHPPFQFYLLRVFDSNQPGLELRYVRYLDDVKRVYAGALADEEFTQRLVREWKQNAEEPVMGDAWLEREVQLGEFLAVQIAYRLKELAVMTDREEYDKLTAADKALARALQQWGVQDCVGWFRDGVFSFAVARATPLGLTPEAVPWPANILQLLARLLAEYRFQDYYLVLLTDATTSVTQQFTRPELQSYHIKR